MKNIIIPIDFSEDSLKALDLAVALSKKIYLNIQMVYVQKKTTEGGLKAVNEEHELAEKKFEHLIATYGKKMGNETKLRYVIKKGRVYQEVVNQANSYNECSIIASTSGASGFEEIFIGSNAQKIIAVSEKPVITVRKEPVPDQIKTIVMPIDDDSATRQKVPFTADLASMLGAEIHIVPISKTQNKRNIAKLSTYAKQVANYLTSRDIANTTKYLYGENASDYIIEYADKVKADLIAINKEKGPSVFKVFTDISQLLVNKSPVPVLSYTPKEIGRHVSFNA